MGEIDIAQGQIRVCPVCRVSIDEVKAKGCGISLEACDLSALRAALANKQKKAAELDAEANGAEQEAKRVEAQIQQLGPRKQALEAEVKAADDASRAAQAGAREVQDRIYRARRIVDDARSLRARETAAKPTPPATTALEAVRAQLESGRSRARAAIRTFEERYQGIMAAWLPDGVAGTVKLDGNGLKVDAEFLGRRRSVNGGLGFPEDCGLRPCRACIWPWRRRRTCPHSSFTTVRVRRTWTGSSTRASSSLVHQWERAVGTPCFQYIVTTTTAPPPELQDDIIYDFR